MYNEFRSLALDDFFFFFFLFFTERRQWVYQHFRFRPPCEHQRLAWEVIRNLAEFVERTHWPEWAARPSDAMSSLMNWSIQATVALSIIANPGWKSNLSRFCVLGLRFLVVIILHHLHYYLNFLHSPLSIVAAERIETYSAHSDFGISCVVQFSSFGHGMVSKNSWSPGMFYWAVQDRFMFLWCTGPKSFPTTIDFHVPCSCFLISSLSSTSMTLEKSRKKKKKTVKSPVQTAF